MPSLKVGLQATAIYIAVVALGMVAIFRIYDAAYGSPVMISHFWPVELILTIITLYYVTRYFGFAGAGFGRMNWAGLIGFLPAYACLAVMLVRSGEVMFSGTLTPADWRILGLVTFTTFLIGFSEEVMFRGVLLRGALVRLSPIQAMLLSALAFSLLHGVNGFAGQTTTNMLYQLAFTFVVGFFLAPLALRIGNLWPLIIWHWMWDFALFSGVVLDISHPYALIGILVQVVISVGMWGAALKQT